MKIESSKGIGLITKKANIISIEQEQTLWEKGILGSSNPQVLIDTMVYLLGLKGILGSSNPQVLIDTMVYLLGLKGILGSSNPQVLIDTMVYLLGLNFALRGGDEHRNLIVEQLSIGRNENGEYLNYTEKTSKCFKRGLKDYSLPPKSVVAYANDDTSKCIVTLFRKYMSLRPENAPSAMYLRPLTKPRDDQWYSVQPIGIHSLQKTVGRMCRYAGFEGFFSNHSLRATCATRLFQSGVDEQLIAKKTGHRSNAIRQYKRESSEQERQLSSIIQGQPSKRKCEETATSSSTSTVTTLDRERVEIAFNVVIKK